MAGRDEVTDPEQTYRQAIACLRRSDSVAAEQCLRQVLAARPDHAAALHLAGLLAGRDGRDAECMALLERAIAAGTPAQQETSGLLLAAAHDRAGRPAAAEAVCRRVLAVVPRSVELLLKLGLVLRQQGRDEAALVPLRQATRTAPDQPLPHAMLAAALHAVGLLDEAAASAARAAGLAPGNCDFAGNWAVICNAQGQFARAETICREALAGGEEPALHNTLGIALKAQGRLDEAAGQFERALALRPGFSDAHYNLATVCKDQGRTGDAVDLLRRLIAASPPLPATRFALCMAHLPPLYQDQAEIDRRRADYSAELAALERYADDVGAVTLAAGVGAAQPFHLAYQGGIDTDLQRRYGELVCRAMAAAYPPAQVASRPKRGERIRVGFVCGHIRRHSVWQLPTRGWVQGLDREFFELFAYHTSADCDAETERARSLFDGFTQGPCSTERWCELIARDRPHVLIYPEIGMDPMVARLAALRLAPHQYTSWGHPTTSGYPTIDYFLTSDDMEPAGADAHYTERLVRLPGLSTPIQVNQATPPIPTRAALGLPDNATIYWSAQSLYKYLPQYDAIFAAIAGQVPNACFVFVASSESDLLTLRFQERLGVAFAAQGLDAQCFCVFLPRMDQDAFHAATGCADVVLDSIGWSGCNSLLDALSHGLPIVTLPGATMRSRHGAALLRRIGLGDAVTDDLDSYVARAVNLGTDSSERAIIRCRTTAGLYRLDDQVAVTMLQQHIVSMVQPD